MRLSPPGSSLYVPLILTSFSHCYYYLQLSSYAHYYKSCVWKCQCKVCVSTNGLKTPELQLWGFCSFASIVDTNHIIFAYRHYIICKSENQYTDKWEIEKKNILFFWNKKCECILKPMRFSRLVKCGRIHIENTNERLSR